MKYNPILNCDSYKFSHYLQYPDGTEYVSSYIESRGGEWNETVFFGLQGFINQYLNTPITPEDIDIAEDLVTAHGLPFNRAGWEYIIDEHFGYLPLKIQAVPEGMVVPTHNVLAQVVNTDPNCFWLTSHIETALLRIWYPTTVATQSREIKKIIMGYLDVTSDDPQGQIGFKLHDFGYRGVSSMESGMIGGAAHLVNFMGTDTFGALLYLRTHYRADMAGFSIPASEHSTITSWGRTHEAEAFRNMLVQFGGKGPLLACVSDSYDVYKACSDLWGTELKDAVLNCGSTLVVRPDSGDPVEVTLKVIEILGEKFGYTKNSKGYKVLHPSVRMIQGDGVNPESIGRILWNFQKHGWSADNIAFGMGGALLQKVDRDTQKFAMKCSAITINGQTHDVYKDPVTDSGKQSKRGRLALVQHEDGRFETIRETQLGIGKFPKENLLQTVWEDAETKIQHTLAEIRDRAKL